MLADLRLITASNVQHVGQLVPSAEAPLLLPLVAEAGVSEALGKLAPAAADVHHALSLVRRAAHGG